MGDVEKGEEYVTIREFFWRKGGEWFMWSELDPDHIHISPIIPIKVEPVEE